MMRKPVSPEGGVYYPALFPLICAALFPGILLSGCNENMKPEQPPANLGEEIFVSNCTACHSLEPGMRKVGPSLHGLLGREVKLSSGKVFLRDKDYIQKSITDPDAEIVAGFDGGICQTSQL
jgi:hypothetical protein